MNNIFFLMTHVGMYVCITSVAFIPTSLIRNPAENIILIYTL